MKKNRTTPRGDHITREEKYLALTADGDWHTNKELVRRVSHTFPQVTFSLRSKGHNISVRIRPGRRSGKRIFEYRRVVKK